MLADKVPNNAIYERNEEAIGNIKCTTLAAL
jgi:hypothetical protein